jgi:hypothetical protein
MLAEKINYVIAVPTSRYHSSKLNVQCYSLNFYFVSTL